MVVPEAEQRLQQVGAAQERAVGGFGGAHHHVVAAAGADMAAVDHELFRGQADLAGFLVQLLAALHDLRPARRGMHVDLDHAGIGRHREMQQARVARRQIALQHHLAAEFGGGVLDRGGERQPVLGGVERREEHVDQAAARLDAERGAHQVRLAAADHRRLLRDRAEPFGAGAHGVGRRGGGAERLARRQGRQWSERIGLGLVLDCLGIRPGQAVERQPVADGRIAGEQEQRVVAEVPFAALPDAHIVADRRGAAAARSRPGHPAHGRTRAPAAPAPSGPPASRPRPAHSPAGGARATDSSAMSSYAGWISDGSTCSRSARAAQNRAASAGVASSVSSSVASSAGSRQTGSPSLRQCA